MILILLGAPGVGKGSYAQLLQEKLHIPHISTGEILRNAITLKSELGQIVKADVTAGKLVDDDIMLDVVEKRLEEEDAKSGAILDGFPRTIAQAEMFDDLLEEKGKHIDFIINMVAPEEVIVRRLSSRRQCSECGTIYNMITNPPLNCDTCKECGGKVFIRPDDRAETVKRRLNIYNEKTYPLLEYYSDHPGFLEIDSSGLLQEGIQHILSEISNRRDIG